MKRTLLLTAFAAVTCHCLAQLPKANEVIGIIEKVNQNWQQNHALASANDWPYRPYTNDTPFWDVAAYHTGNMEVCKLTPALKQQFIEYTETWASHNHYMGATGTDKALWEYHYGETPNHVLFGDWQICFQTYADLYALELATQGKADPNKIARAREVMEYEMSTSANDYWWWSDGLYMVMPVMTKMYRQTGNAQYIEKLLDYWSYAKQLMYDEESHLFYRDAKYIYPKHQTANQRKDFWSRGNGWVLAALAKVQSDMNSKQYQKLAKKERKLHKHDTSDPKQLEAFKQMQQEAKQTFLEMAQALKDCQQPEGYWTRSLIDEQQAPGPETSGTAFFTYGLLWGVNNGLLSRQEYLPVVEKAWKYLTAQALQPDGSVGYVQPIGERAIPGQTVDKKSTANFGVGAFLLAASEMYRLVK